MHKKIIAANGRAITINELTSKLSGDQKLVMKMLIHQLETSMPHKDASHDVDHSMRVLYNALYISRHEGGDVVVIVAASLLHDIVNIPKGSPGSKNAAEFSAIAAEDILRNIAEFPKEKILFAQQAIREHSFSKGIKPTQLESMILQDADRLDSLGVIGIYRAFHTAGMMGSELLHYKDPFCASREPDSVRYGLDFLLARLLKVKDTMNTSFARKLADDRTEFLKRTLLQLEKELYVYGD